MPDVVLDGTGKLDENLCERLETEVAKAIAESMPCKLSAVIITTHSAQGKEKPMNQRSVTAKITTMFLYDKSEQERREIVKRVKAAVESKIHKVLPGIHFAEAFLFDSIPASPPPQ